MIHGLSELEALIALNQVPKTGPIRVRRLLEYFGSATAVLEAGKGDLSRVEGIGPGIADAISNWEKIAHPGREIEEAAKRDITILTRDDEAYPEPLRRAADGPVLLYVWGTLSPDNALGVGIVGSRRCTHYGAEQARKFSYQLAGAGFTVLSGLARGIDTAAHEGAVAANGRTIAVLGSGLLQLYPAENMALAEQIAAGNGAVVSEFPLHTPPDKRLFPQRNRVVAHWGQALLVVECPARSGSLITANLAVEANKTIYAIPGPIDRPQSGGCHQLIRDGATLVTDAGQILDDFSMLPLGDAPALPARPNITLSPEEETLLAALQHAEASLEDLQERTKIPIGDLMVHLMKMELNQLIITLPGQRYRRRDVHL